MKRHPISIQLFLAAISIFLLLRCTEQMSKQHFQGFLGAHYDDSGEGVTPAFLNPIFMILGLNQIDYPEYRVKDSCTSSINMTKINTQKFSL